MNIRRKAQRNIRKEFLRFKRELFLRHTKGDIWEACEKIHFYTCMREYFQLNEKIPRVYLELAQARRGLIGMAWDEYLKEERLRYQTWPELEELLEAVLLKWRMPRAT